jgi:hypothetical protein
VILLIELFRAIMLWLLRLTGGRAMGHTGHRRI